MGSLIYSSACCSISIKSKDLPCKLQAYNYICFKTVFMYNKPLLALYKCNTLFTFTIIAFLMEVSFSHLLCT